MNKKIFLAVLCTHIMPIVSEAAHPATAVPEKDDWSWLFAGSDTKTPPTPPAQEPLSVDRFIEKIPSLSPLEKQKLLSALLAENNSVPLPSSSDKAVESYLKKLETCLDTLHGVIKNSSALNAFKGTDLQKQLNNHLSSKLSFMLTLLS